MDKPDYEVASKILASKHRSNIVRELLDGARTPTELAEKFEEHQPTISRALGELRDAGMVKSTSQRRARLYWIPEEREEIAEYVQERNR